MENTTPQKQGLGPLAWIGIGCGGIIALAIVGFVVLTFVFGGKFKQFAEDAQKDPTRMTATMMVNVSGGKFEMVAEDEPGKRYTVREKQSGALTTIYWSERTKKAEIIQGDFSAIPAIPGEPNSPPVPAPPQ